MNPNGNAWSAGSGTIVDVQAMRGLAALMVMLFHSGTIYTAATGELFLGNAFRTGFIGVNIFFVLSGFILFWVHEQDFGRRDRLRPYLIKRFIRIYPLYWIILLLKVAKDFLGGGVSATVILSALLLVPYPSPPFINVSWTLSYEIFFYAIFSLAIFLPRGILSWAPFLLLAALPFVPAPTVSASEDVHALISFPFNHHVLEFSLGAVVAKVARINLSSKVAWASTLFGAAAFISSITASTIESGKAALSDLNNPQLADKGSNLYFDNEVFFFSIPVAFLLYGLVRLEQLRSKPTMRWLTQLGDISYPLYLVHGFVIAWSLKAPSFLALVQDCPAWMVGPWVTALLGAWVLHRVVEKPLLAWTRKRLSGRQIQAKSVSAGL